MRRGRTMNRNLAGVLSLIASTGVLVALSAQSAPTTWLSVNVMQADGRLVTNLTAADLEVEDNGEKREISSFQNDPIPVALAIMVDVSASMESNYGLVRRAVSALTSNFKPGDRAIVGSFDALPWISDRFSARPDEIMRMLSSAMSLTAVSGTLALCDGDWIDRSAANRFSGRSQFGSEFRRRQAVHGGSAIWDGAACGVHAAASDGETPRRILLLLTDGQDTMSFENVSKVVERAKRLGVMIYGISLVGGFGVNGGDLRALAEQTGGGYFHLTTEAEVSDAFARISDELRHQFVVGFSPNGGANAARKVVVRTRIPNATVQFRQVTMDMTNGRPIGNAIAGGRVAPPVGTELPTGFTRTSKTGGPAPATPAVPVKTVRTPLWDTLDEFSSPDWNVGSAPRMSISALRGMLSTLRKEAEGWIQAAPVADQAQRRIAVGGFVLDLLYTQNDPYLWLDNQPVPDVIEWAANVLQAGAPTTEERLWFLGVLALSERSGIPVLVERVAQRAQRRFPVEGRFVLARAIAQDLRTWPEERDVKAFAPAPDVAAGVMARYEEALARPDIRTEALLRIGYFELRRGRIDASLERFAAIDALPADDVVLRYWFHLLKGRALEAANKMAEAIESYGQALDEVPAATSARAALVSALVKSQQGPDGARLAREALLTQSAPLDPWTIYVLPDMRYWGAISDQFRKVVAR